MLAGLREGRIDLPKAQEIAYGTCELDPGVRVRLAELAVGYAEGHTRAQLRAWLTRRVAAIDPAAVQRRRKKAVRARRVWITPDTDGMATLGAYLSAEEAQACWNALVAGAANIEGGIDPARADLLVARLTGLELGQPVPVQVLLTPGGPELAGHGPLSPHHTAELCQHAQLIDLTAARASRGYRPAPGPGPPGPCPRPALPLPRLPPARRCMCDLDHVIPHPAGPTSESNLAALCRYHHRLKTHTAWSVRMKPGATLEWTSPRGHIFHTTLHDP